MNSLKGSCLCGAVKFELEGRLNGFYLCHCSRCRKDTGSAHAANLFFDAASLQWVSGEDNVSSFTLPSSQHARSFCSVCGSALPNLQMGGKMLVVPAGSLDDDWRQLPDAHVNTSSKASWDEHLEKVPTYAEYPDKV